MRHTHFVILHSGCRWRALLCMLVIGAMALASARPAAAAACSPTYFGSHSKLFAKTKSTGTGKTKIGWMANYTFPSAQFSSIDPTISGTELTVYLDTYSHQLPTTVWPGPGACTAGNCGWWHNAAFTKWRWKTANASDLSVTGNIKGVWLKYHSTLGTMTVKVAITANAADTPYSVSTAPLGLDGLIDDGLTDCLTTDSSSQCVQFIDPIIPNTGWEKCSKP